MAPIYLTEKFEFNRDFHSYNTRHARDITIRKTNKQYFNNSFRISSSKIWNELPQDLKDCLTIGSFKKKIFKHYLAKEQF